MSLEQAIAKFARGEIIIVTDHHDRENEGDLVFAAELATPEKVNFMTKYGRGLVCVTITPTHAMQLDLQAQPVRNNNAITCAFTTSVDAACLNTSGISAVDRSLTISKIAHNNAQASDLATPGHIFPVVAHPSGLSARHGHTEASIELCHRAGLFPSAVICEILAEDGSAALLKDLNALAQEFDLPIISISSLLETMK